MICIVLIEIGRFSGPKWSKFNNSKGNKSINLEIAKVYNNKFLINIHYSGLHFQYEMTL